MRHARRSERTISATERTRVQALRAQIETEKEEILTAARRHKAAHDAAATGLRSIMRLLCAERARQSLSLADIQARTGIARSALSRLETDPDANPTLTTITRYAEALGKDLRVLLTDKSRGA